MEMRIGSSCAEVKAAISEKLNMEEPDVPMPLIEGASGFAVFVRRNIKVVGSRKRKGKL